VPGPDGLLRIALKKPFSDGTVAVDLDPLSLLCRLAALVPHRGSTLKRTFGMDVETCPRCGGHMRLMAVITDLSSAARLLRHLGEPTEPPARAPARAPPFWQSRVLRRHQEQPGHSTQMGLFEEH
jgi:hypothetical protein